VTFDGPEGVVVEVLGPAAEPVGVGEHPGLLTVGLRQGLGYRLKLSNLPNRPEKALYPVVEVVGHLHRPTGADPSRYPVRIVFRDEDLESASDNGRLITQIVYLEDPEQAIPVHLPKNEVPSVDLSPAENPLRVAAALGRPMAIVHLGSRVPSEFEMSGAPILPLEAAPCPFVGSSGDECGVACGIPCTPPPKPRNLPKDEYLCDGGDHREMARAGARGDVSGIEPRDAVIQFHKPTPEQIEPKIDELRERLRKGEISRVTFELQVRRLYQSTVGDGRPRVLPTNVVCIYAPRFAAVRQSIGANETRTIDVPISAERHERDQSIAARQKLGRFVRQQTPELARGRDRASALTEKVFAGVYTELRVLGVNDAVTNPAGHVRVQTPETSLNRERPIQQQQNARPEGIKAPEGLVMTGIVEGSGEAIMAWKPQELASVEEPPSRPGIEVLKQASIVEAQPGDLVTFTINFRNMGNMVIGSVSIVDSLLPRLEYVAGTAKGPAGAVFTARPNQAGSTELRWDLKGALSPGAVGSVSFQAQVR
jgi:uncharacterized repeat protein (TIGR01451 family)